MSVIISVGEYRILDTIVMPIFLDALYNNPLNHNALKILKNIFIKYKYVYKH